MKSISISVVNQDDGTYRVMLKNQVVGECDSLKEAEILVNRIHKYMGKPEEVRQEIGLGQIIKEAVGETLIDVWEDPSVKCKGCPFPNTPICREPDPNNCYFTTVDMEAVRQAFQELVEEEKGELVAIPEKEKKRMEQEAFETEGYSMQNRFSSRFVEQIEKASGSLKDERLLSHVEVFGKKEEIICPYWDIDSCEVCSYREICDDPVPNEEQINEEIDEWGKESKKASRRILKNEIETLDMSKDKSYIREVEMTLELGSNNNVPLMMQFFKDLETYGLDESILYAESYEEDGELESGTVDKLKGITDRIKKDMGKSEKPKERSEVPGDKSKKRTYTPDIPMDLLEDALNEGAIYLECPECGEERGVEPDSNGWLCEKDNIFIANPLRAMGII